MAFKLNKYKYQLLLIITVVILAVVNYTPGTWLTGWDDSHPEFNFGLNIYRTINAVWREHRGLGLVSGLAHSAQIFRYIFLWVCSVVIPLSFIRYLWQFLMLLLGPLGVYYFSKEVLFGKNRNGTGDRGAFISALFYLLNLVTLQTFYVPLETFTTQYGFLPWLLLYIFRLLKQPNTRDLLIFAVLNVVSASQAFTPTLFFAYLIFVLLVILAHLLARSAGAVKHSALVLMVLFISNIYWILPFGYFLLSGTAEQIPQSTINILSSEDSFLMNKEHGNLKDFSALRGFLFTTTDFNQQTNSYEWLLDKWVVHQSNPVVTAVGYVLFLIVTAGLIISVINIKRSGQKAGYITLALFFLAGFFFLMGDNPPFGPVFRFFQNNLPFFGEALRFPFTKFSVLTGFTFSVLFGLGFLWIIRAVPAVWHFVPVLFTVVMLTAWTLPMFGGSLIYSRMRVKIPDEYFKMFSWLNSREDNGRVLKLPVQTYWSWGFNDWGYRGSGFTWYGIKQSTIDRAFDVWSAKNESVYREISYAIYANDRELFNDIVKKYDISYILVDASVYEPKVAKSSPFMGTDSIYSFLSDTSVYKHSRTFGFLNIYETLNKPASINTVAGAGNVTPDVNWLPKDEVYGESGAYFMGDAKQAENYPFRGLGNYLTADLKYQTTSSADYYRINTRLNEPGRIIFPDYFSAEKTVPVKVVVSGGEISLHPVFPSFYSNGRELEVYKDAPLYTIKLPAGNTLYVFSIDHDVYGPFSADEIGKYLGSALLDTVMQHKLALWSYSDSKQTDLMNLYKQAEPDSCVNQDAGSYELQTLADGIKLTSENNVACIAATYGKVSDFGLFSIDIKGKFENSKVDYCVYGINDCLNDRKFSGRFLVSDNIPLPLTVQLYSTPVNMSSPSVSTFNDIKLTGYPLIQEYKMEPLFVQDAIHAKTTEVQINAGDFTAEVSKLTDYPKAYIYEDFNNVDLATITHDCGFDSDNRVDADFKKTMTFINKELELSTKDKSSCFTLSNKYLSHNTGYMMEIPFKRISGESQQFCLQNDYTGRCDVIYKLRSTGKFFTPAFTDGEKGYKLTIENKSIGNDVSTNSYDNIGLYPFPYNLVTGIHTGDDIPTVKVASNITSLRLDKLSNFMYRSDVNVKSGELLSLNQSFDRGWIAICGVGGCNAGHVLVNNWSNGWMFKDAYNGGLVLFFWPQLLEYIGLTVLPVMGLTLAIRWANTSTEDSTK